MLEIKEIKKGEDGYPPLLIETSNPPEKLFFRGKLPDFNLPWIAIVGTRKATPDGLQLAKKTSYELASRGFVIVSGLAMGMDTAAHEGAVKAGGKTVAVLGCGIDKIYPAQNENLANTILNGHGAIISEYAPGAPILRYKFLERNRIVAGLCAATIVIEAPDKSGALVTARLAAECGREVFVFPGFTGSPQYRGSHKLIRDGARLVDSLDDIIEDLGAGVLTLFNGNLKSKPLAEKAIPNQNLSKDEEAVLGLIKSEKKRVSIDRIIEITKLTPQAINQILTNLIVCGIVEEDILGYSLRNN